MSEQEKLIKKKMSEILSNFSNQKYQRLTDDRLFENVPDSLWELWYSDGNHSFAVCNMDYYFLKYRLNDLSADYMLSHLSELTYSLEQVFAQLRQIGDRPQRNNVNSYHNPYQTKFSIIK